MITQRLASRRTHVAPTLNLVSIGGAFATAAAALPVTWLVSSRSCAPMHARSIAVSATA